MRPLRLEVEGFTCFRERQGVVDFTRLALFAIAGPTGSGKTSLLDAIVFALFGRVPRTGVQGVGELVSLGRDRMSVVLDFRVGRHDYRVARTVHRAKNRPTRALIERLDTDAIGRPRAGEPLADGVQEVARVVRQILGFDYETFVRAVVLPQGEFAAFLRSPPGKQREILRELLRLNLFEDMRRLATRERDRATARREGVERRLEEDYADATPEQVEEAEAGLADLIERIVEADARVDRAEESLERLRQRRATTVELERARAELERWTLTWETEGLTDVARRLAAAERAAPAVSALAAAEDARLRWETRRARLDEASSARRKARRALEQARLELETARSAGQRLPDLRETAATLDRWLALRRPLAAAAARLETARGRHDATERELRGLSDEVRSRETELEEAREAVEALAREHGRLGWDARERDRLAGGRERALELRGLRAALRESEDRLGRLDGELRRAEERVDLHLARVEEAQERERRRQERETEGRLRARWRSGLRPGVDCPVCGRAVSADDPLPGVPGTETPAEDPPQTGAGTPGEVLPALAHLEDALLSAREEAAGLRREKETSVARQVRDRRELGRGERELRALLHGGGATPDDIEVENGLLARLEELRRIELRERELRESRVEAQRLSESLGAKAAALRDRCRTLESRREELTEEIRVLSSEHDELREKAGPDPGPGAEERRRALTSEIHALEAAVETSAERERSAAVASTEAGARADEASLEVVSAEALLRDAEERSERAWRVAGFVSAHEVRSSAMSEERREELSRRVAEVRGARDASRRRVAALTERLEDDPVEEVELARAREATEAHRAEAVALRERSAAIRDRLGELRDRAARREKLLQELEGLRGAVRVQGRLAKDLRSDAFQAYLLDESFRRLVAGASERLARLVDRYTLDLEGGRFVVVDHDHAGQRRSADTLSGGETFLASLALALELSEQVQQAAGAVTIDSLFVDEGFGTLDAETLDTVTSAIEALPRSGRMVGIITHLPELTDRLPERIVVEPGPEGSRILVGGEPVVLGDEAGS